ncbi:metallophosphoesterase [Nocardiopsis sp. NPDC049922]|uniref:metallophosphoesterase family protein n=1 Tax=Nocardiopsis sp. NPDC049922 TaxID=3155157 RepID=UPI0033EDC915
MKRILVISDTQIPYEDRRALRNVVRFISTYKPDEVVHIGDLMDYPQPSRWSKDTRAEFEGSIFKDSEYAKKSFLEPLRKAYSGPIKVIEGNHDERPRLYLEKHAPALAESEQFHFETLLDFDGFGIETLRGFYDFAPDWVMTHGHLGLPLSGIAGRSAMRAANKIGKSVVQGHTHRLGQCSETYGYRGKTHTRTGIEVGNLMDIKKAGYLRAGSANWQKGFAIMHVDGSSVTPELIPIHKNGSFVASGFVFDGKSKAA